MKNFKLTVVTAANGTGTGTTPRFSGKVKQIEYVKHGVTPYTDGVDFAIAGVKTGIGLWTEANVNASAVRAPRQPLHSQVGVALLFAAGGTALADEIAFGNDQVTVTVTNGGDTKTGTFYIVVE